MNMLEPALPKNLKETQEWFASIITQPLDNGRIARRTPRNKSIEKEASAYILPSPSLQSHERIEIYNQQFWWRLLSTLQESFPFLVRLFGTHDFNRIIAVPYLNKYPPNYWTLNVLGNRLPKWVREKYYAEDRELILDAALIDSAFSYAFFTKQMPYLKIENATLDTKLYLQPHVQLFKLPYNLFSFRKEFLKETPEYWVENDFPELVSEREYFFMIFRKTNNQVIWQEITHFEYAILQKLALGDSIEGICAWLESQSTAFQKEAETKLSQCFKTWAAEHLVINQKP